MTPAGNLDDDVRLQRCVQGLRSVARVGVCPRNVRVP
jgi:hypothetical protein